MAKISIGSLTTFNHEVQEWSIYKDRLDQWFLANEIGETEDKAKCKRRAILLSSFAENTYKLVRDLALPSKLASLEYDIIVKLLDEHFKTAKCGFAERYRFYVSIQSPSENFSEWAARVRGLATDCGFSSSILNETLRDRFVLGMQPGAERDKLFTIPMEELSLNKAIELAEGIRCARLGAAQATPASGAAGSAAAYGPPRDELAVLALSASPAPGARRSTIGSYNPTQPQRKDTCKCCGYAGHQVTAHRY